LQVDYTSVISVLTRLLEACGRYVTAKQSNLSHWHPVLGWFSVSLDAPLRDSMDRVKYQLARLWSPQGVKLLARPAAALAEKMPAMQAPAAPAEPPAAGE